MVGRRDLHAVEIPLLLEELAEVDVAGDALELLRCPLLRVVGLDDMLCHVATGPDSGVFPSPVGVAERPPYAVAEPGLVPVDVVRGVLDGIADRRDLHVRNGDPPQQLADCLGAAPDERHRDLVAGSDMAAPAEHVSRHDGEGRYSGGGRGQELATIDVVFGCHGDLSLGNRSRGWVAFQFDFPRWISYSESPRLAPSDATTLPPHPKHGSRWGFARIAAALLLTS